MKPIYYKKYWQDTDSSFLVKYAEVPHTFDRFHFHNEYELMFNIQNRGTRFVGDSIRRFDNGDLVLVGPNTPHYWHSDDIFFKGDEKLMAKVILIQFSRDFLGSHFFDIPEMYAVKELLHKATRGVQVLGNERKIIGELLLELPESKGWEQLLKLIHILCLLSHSPKVNLLASTRFNQSIWMKDESKISRVFNYIMHNYQNEISLDEVAAHSSMNKASFCRYFKKAANKTFSQALNEIRIGFACKEMIYSDLNISEIAFACGYANVTYFNKVFKEIKKCTPLAYRSMHLNNKEGI
ncbi:MAG: AraC family transcriptional regulator [Cyclobacteriaceae bacterium]|nr:AraC family transcriptional regulator [Cyclobacteriaceae bacterium]